MQPYRVIVDFVEVVNVVQQDTFHQGRTQKKGMKENGKNSSEYDCWSAPHDKLPIPACRHTPQ